MHFWFAIATQSERESLFYTEYNGILFIKTDYYPVDCAIYKCNILVYSKFNIIQFVFSPLKRHIIAFMIWREKYTKFIWVFFFFHFDFCMNKNKMFFFWNLLNACMGTWVKHLRFYFLFALKANINFECISNARITSVHRTNILLNQIHTEMCVLAFVRIQWD